MDLQSSQQSRAEQLITAISAVMMMAVSLPTWADSSQPSRLMWFTYTALAGYAVYTLILVCLGRDGWGEGALWNSPRSPVIRPPYNALLIITGLAEGSISPRVISVALFSYMPF